MQRVNKQKTRKPVCANTWRLGLVLSTGLCPSLSFPSSGTHTKGTQDASGSWGSKCLATPIGFNCLKLGQDRPRNHQTPNATTDHQGRAPPEQGQSKRRPKDPRADRETDHTPGMAREQHTQQPGHDDAQNKPTRATSSGRCWFCQYFGWSPFSWVGSSFSSSGHGLAPLLQRWACMRLGSAPSRVTSKFLGWGPLPLCHQVRLSNLPS